MGGVIDLLLLSSSSGVVWFAFLSVSVVLVCFLGVVHMSQPVAG